MGHSQILLLCVRQILLLVLALTNDGLSQPSHLRLALRLRLTLGPHRPRLAAALHQPALSSPLRLVRPRRAKPPAQQPMVKASDSDLVKAPDVDPENGLENAKEVTW